MLAIIVFDALDQRFSTLFAPQSIVLLGCDQFGTGFSNAHKSRNRSSGLQVRGGLAGATTALSVGRTLCLAKLQRH